ncbi:MAG: GtrA family protein [Paludibacteraceae bacterium]
MKRPLHNIFYTPTEQISILMFRYAIVMCIAYVIDATCLFLLTEYGGIHYLVSSVLSSLCGGVANYLFSISPYVFGRSGTRGTVVEFLLFTAIGAGGLALNLLVMWLLTDCLHTHYMVSKIFAVVVVFLWTFFVRRRLLMRGKQHNETITFKE